MAKTVMEKHTNLLQIFFSIFPMSYLIFVSKIMHGIVLQHVVSATASIAFNQVGLISRSFSSLLSFAL